VSKGRVGFKSVFKSAILLPLLFAAEPLLANVYVEQTFQAKMAQADLVVVVTVVSMDPGHRGQWDSTATVRPIAALKGVPPSAMLVRTRDRVAESDSDCCQAGATYVMFLQLASDRSAFVPVNAKYGMIRIGPARDDPEIRAVPPR
jgi:hypothetical protein